MPSIFVSHSSQDGALTEAVCTALKAAPGGDLTTFVDYDVLVDYERLRAGQTWPTQLHEWLARCHAGLILLTPNAVRSPWVLKEATILAWRFVHEQPTFPLFVVKYTGVSAEDLKREKFDPLDLRGIQLVVATDPAGIAATIRGELPQQVPPTQYERLRGRLQDLFVKLGVNTLADVAERLCGNMLGWPREEAYKAKYGDEIVRRLINGDLGGYTGVDELVGDLSLSDAKSAVEQILNIVAPYWVDLSAAGRLPRLIDAQPRRAAALNGALVGRFTAEMYVRRAHPLSRLYYSIPLRGGAKGDPAEHFTRQICEYFRSRRELEGDDAEIIAQLQRRKRGTYVVLPGPIDDISLQTLLTRFDRLTFLLWPDEVLEPDDALNAVDWLEPPVDLDREQLESESYDAARAIVARMA